MARKIKNVINIKEIATKFESDLLLNKLQDIKNQNVNDDQYEKKIESFRTFINEKNEGQNTLSKNNQKYFNIIKEIFEILIQNDFSEYKKKLDILFENNKSQIRNFDYSYLFFYLLIDYWGEFSSSYQREWQDLQEKKLNFIKESSKISSSFLKNDIFIDYIISNDKVLDSKNYESFHDLVKSKIIHIINFKEEILDLKILNNLISLDNVVNKKGTIISKFLNWLNGDICNKNANFFNKPEQEKIIRKNFNLLKKWRENSQFPSESKDILDKVIKKWDSDFPEKKQTESKNDNNNTSILNEIANFLFDPSCIRKNNNTNIMIENDLCLADFLEYRNENISRILIDNTKIIIIEDKLKEIQNSELVSNEFKEYIKDNKINNYALTLCLYIEIENMIYKVINLLIKKDKDNIDFSILNKPEKNSIKEKIYAIEQYLKRIKFADNYIYILRLIIFTLYNLKLLNLRNLDIHKAQIRDSNTEVKIYSDYEAKAKYLLLIIKFFIDLYEKIEKDNWMEQIWKEHLL